MANFALIPWLRRWWDTLTWGRIDLTIVHSQLQVKTLAQTCPQARAICIPHYVPPALPLVPLPPNLAKAFEGPGPFLVVFGFITPSKGQDLAIQIMPQLLEKLPQARLILAGAARTLADQQFESACKELAQNLGVAGRVSFTGFVDERSIPGLYEKATLVLAPFRETTGSGSLATAFAYGAPVLASDLPLNREVFERLKIPIQSLNAASTIEALLSKRLRDIMRQSATKYASSFSPTKIAGLHLEAYASRKNEGLQ
jgi:glycosyltransferase involved in cell wall biosynthesis